MYRPPFSGGWRQVAATSPASRQRATISSNNCSKSFDSRNRPCRFFENGEWCGISKPKPVNQRHAKCMRSSSTSLRSLVRLLSALSRFDGTWEMKMETLVLLFSNRISARQGNVPLHDLRPEGSMLRLMAAIRN